MVKVYKGADSIIESPQEGWGTLIFSDAYKCQVSMSRVGKKEGKEVVWFYLMPFESTIKKFKIDIKNDLDRIGYTWRAYPIEMVRLLNSFDPARRVYFCLLDYKGDETENTKWFKGVEQADEIIRLKREIRMQKAHNEELKKENFMLKINVEKYIKKNFDGMMKPLIPLMRGIISAESHKGGE